MPNNSTSVEERSIAPSSPGPDQTLPGMIVDALRVSMADGIDEPFAKYIRQHQTGKWLIFSDYVLKQSGRPNDAFAFTVMPGGHYHNPLIAEFAATATKDLKDVRRISDSMIRLLSDSRLFTFCFVIKPSRVMTRNVGYVRGMLDRTILMLESGKNAGAKKLQIDKLKAMRRKAASQSFNVRLFEDIILATTFAGFLSYLICREERAARLGWFSDRDSITTSHDAFADHCFATNVSVFCQRFLNGWPGPALGVNADIKQGSLWCDPFLRVPDHFAGGVSAWDIEKNEVPPKPDKYLQILAEGIAGHENVNVIRLEFKSEHDTIQALSARVRVTRK